MPRLWVRVVAAALVVSAGAGSSLAQQSVARQWDEQLLSAIRLDRPRPPIHARNLYHVSVAMYDAWAAYEPAGIGRADQVLHHERAVPPQGMSVDDARNQAVSQAAFRMIKHRFANAVGAATTLASLNAKMVALGYDPNFVGTVGNSPAALGNRIFETVRAAALADGSNEAADYANTINYQPINEPLIFKLPGVGNVLDPNRWQPLAFDYLVLQNGIPVGQSIQTFICPHWDAVTSFALTRPAPGQHYVNPGPPPLLGTATDAAFKSQMVEVIQLSSQLDPNDGVTLDISPGAFHNNPLGSNSGTGYPVNPVTGVPYPPNVVKRADYARVLAEFWADGPQSETPPGHWNVLANYVSDHPLTVKRIGGVGPVCADLEWDVKIYLAVNGAVHDAAIAAWGIKGLYDSSRPITGIRYMGVAGQSSDPMQPSYDPEGLPLIPGLIELVTEQSIQPGQRHENIPDRNPQGVITDPHIGEIAIRAWRGQPLDPLTQIGGVGWILASKWMPYQKANFVTPPFAAYISGHSTFSRSAAEVMTGMTGSPYFPGGLGTYTMPANAYLSFELGPTTNVTLQWASYYDAADEAGRSRLYGGIHIQADDFVGRQTGAMVGKTALAHAKRYFQGRITCAADFNGSGAVSVQDIFDYLTKWFQGDLDADINRNGAVTVQDLFEFLALWFTGC